MSEKVKVSKEVAEAIKEFRRCEESNADILAAILGNANSKSAQILRQFSRINMDGLLNALVNGYEIELSPEDKVREYYNSQTERVSLSIAHDNAPYATRKVLELLGKQVEGVNA